MSASSLDGVVIVIPCYNEAARLDIGRLLAFAGDHPGLRFLLVDDGSTDATWTALQRLVSRHPESFRAIRLLRNSGKAEAVRQGMLAALAGSARYVGYWDADLATPLGALLDFCRVLDDRPGIEVVIGSRVQLLGRDIQRRPGRHYLGRAFATAVSMVLQIPVYDTQCGSKVLRVRSDTQALFAEPFHTRWTFDVELLARFIAAHARPGSRPAASMVYEITLTQWHDVPGSKLRKRDFLRAALDLARIWRMLRRPRRSPRVTALPQSAAAPAIESEDSIAPAARV